MRLAAPRCRRRRGCVLHPRAQPWGFSWWRRTTQENVDLNRNFTTSQPLPGANPATLPSRRCWCLRAWPSVEVDEACSAMSLALPAGERCSRPPTSGQRSPEGICSNGGRPDVEPPRCATCGEHGRRSAHRLDRPPHRPAQRRASVFMPAATMRAALVRRWAWRRASASSIYDGSSTSASADRPDVDGRLRDARRPSTPASRWNAAPSPVTSAGRAARRPVAGEPPEAGAAQRGDQAGCRPLHRHRAWKQAVLAQGIEGGDAGGGRLARRLKSKEVVWRRGRGRRGRGGSYGVGHCWRPDTLRRAGSRRNSFHSLRSLHSNSGDSDDDARCADPGTALLGDSNVPGAAACRAEPVVACEQVAGHGWPSKAERAAGGGVGEGGEQHRAHGPR